MVLQIIKRLSECLTLYTFNNYYVETKDISLLFSRAFLPIRVLNPQHTTPFLIQAGLAVKLVARSLPPS